jgi:FHS family L-fucose permease-like MFS transporter
LNFAQAFNGLGATLAAGLGGRIILTGHSTGLISEGTSPEEAARILHAEAATVQGPYLTVAAVVLTVMFVFIMLPMPALAEEGSRRGFSLKRLLASSRLRGALWAQFFYVGAQVGIGSFFIRYSMQQGGMTDRDAAIYLSIALFLFMAGRFAGSWLMGRVKPVRLL